MLITKNYLLSKEYYIRVKTGEDINAISKKTLIPVGIILKNNPDSKFEPGDMIRIPKLNGLVYQVKPMENFKSVAEKFDVSIDDLIEINSNHEPRPFDKIIIPIKNK